MSSSLSRLDGSGGYGERRADQGGSVVEDHADGHALQQRREATLGQERREEAALPQLREDLRRNAASEVDAAGDGSKRRPGAAVQEKRLAESRARGANRDHAVLLRRADLEHLEVVVPDPGD